MSATTARPTHRVSSRWLDSGWLHVCNGLNPRRDGGMIPSVLGMTGALARTESVTIVTPTPSLCEPSALPPNVTLKGPVSDLEPWVRDAEVVHLHGLWQRQTRDGARFARRYRVPYLIAAHGMAEPWALRQKALKKRIYAALVESKNLRLASCLHALSRPEVGHLRALAPRHTPIALVPNGVDLTPFQGLPSRAELESELPSLAGKFLLLFYARLHIKKGLDLLAEAIGSLASEYPELHVLVAGNDDGAKAPFERRLTELGFLNRVTFLGHVAGAQARRVWGAADAFVLPSYSEGFSMAILEALAARKPVLVTTACHFPELAAAEAGIVVEPTIAGVTRGLRELLDRSPADRASLADRGRALVEARYTWDRQAAHLVAVYHWAAVGGPIPEAVEIARECERSNEGAS